MNESLMYPVRAGRQTGNADWRAARGEAGDSSSAAAAVPAEGQGGTRWRLLKAGQLKGALVRASGENEPAETADKVR